LPELTMPERQKRRYVYGPKNNMLFINKSFRLDTL